MALLHIIMKLWKIKMSGSEFNTTLSMEPNRAMDANCGIEVSWHLQGCVAYIHHCLTCLFLIELLE